MLSFWKLLTPVFIGLVAFFPYKFAQAGLFDDEEARKAILDLRQRVETNKQASEAAAQRLAEESKRNADRSAERSAEDAKRAAEENAQLRRSLLELQNQIQILYGEIAKLRGQDEQMARDVSELQRHQKDISQGVDDRLRKFEPTKVLVDGREFNAEPNEKRDFEAALATFRKGEFTGAQSAFVDFVKRYPQSGYAPSALFWLGNAQYATRDYISAINNFRNMIALAPDHPKSSEAALSIANCQIEIKDTKAARKTLEDLMKVYPQSEAAVAAKDRLAKLR